MQIINNSKRQKNYKDRKRNNYHEQMMKSTRPKTTTACAYIRNIFQQFKNYKK